MNTIRAARAAPWKAVTELRRLAALPLIRAYFAVAGVRWGPGWLLYGRPLIQRHAGSRIQIGRGFVMRNWFGSNPLGVDHRGVLCTWRADAYITIGDDVGMTGTVIVAESGVRIGDRVLIGANSTIIDTDFHPLSPAARAIDITAGATRPITIENDVFIGMGALILKGSHIGQGAVIGAGSVVAGHVPEGTIYAGNPARMVGKVEDHGQTRQP